MELIDKALQDYVEKHSQEAPELLQELERETCAKILMPRMISGHLQGRVLSMLSWMLRPRRILEIGTYTGYSALCLAEGLAQDGQLTTIDINKELEDMVRRYFKKAGMENQIDYLLGNALDIIPALDMTFDLVFIDADKINYTKYFDLVIDKVRQGGFIIADNVLWSGKVLEKNRKKKIDKDTQAILDFNRKVQENSKVENVLFPVRDGLMVMRKT